MLCPQCGILNADNASYCQQCGNALTTASSQKDVQNNQVAQLTEAIHRLRRYIPSVVAEGILHDQERLRGERREVTVLFADAVEFTHLSGSTASPEFAQGLLTRLDERLTNTGYQVWQTPFGYFCEWDLSVYGDSLAKVFKEL